MKITIKQLEYIETQLRDDGQLTLADQLKYCIKKIAALTIPMQLPVMLNFAEDVSKYFIGKKVIVKCDISPYDKDIHEFVIKYIDFNGKETGEKGFWIRGEESVWFNINSENIMRIGY